MDVLKLIAMRAEPRFGKALLTAGAEGADAVIARVAGALAAHDEEVGVVVDSNELRIIGQVTRINDLPVPRWLKHHLARRNGVLCTPQGRAAFGKQARP